MEKSIEEKNREKTKLTEEMRRLLEDLRVPLFGIGSTERFSVLPRNRRPEALLPGARSVISAAFPVIPSSHDWGLRSVNPAEGKADAWAMIDFVGRRLDLVMYEAARFLLDKGYRVTWQPTFPKMKKEDFQTEFHPWEEEAAVSQVITGYFCGLGSIGLNHLLLTRKYGPRIRLNSIITDAPLIESPMSEDLCTRCGRCLAACPVRAFRRNPSIQGLVPTSYNKEACWKSRVLHHTNHECDYGGRCIIACPIGMAARPESANVRQGLSVRKENQ